MAAGPFGEAAADELPLRKYSVTIGGMSGSLAGAPSRPSTKPEGRTRRTVGWGPRGGSIPRIGARSRRPPRPPRPPTGFSRYGTVRPGPARRVSSPPNQSHEQRPPESP